jgi:DNA-directed RNA polymerase specialized sigma24 family protein
VLVDFLGFTSGEAGRLLGLRDSSVRSELHRARTVLSAKLKDGEQ